MLKRIEKRKFGGKDFEHALSLTGPGSKLRARKAAEGYRLRGFYTRVVQFYPDSHEVYIRSKRRTNPIGPKASVTLGGNYYFCTRCRKKHSKLSKIGKAHKVYAWPNQRHLLNPRNMVRR